MALRKDKVSLRFGGLNTKADPKTVPMTQLLGCENAVFTKQGTLSKRFGYDALPTDVLGQATPYSGARGLAARGSELVLFTEDHCYSYVDGAAKWSDTGVVQSVAQSDKVIAKQSSAQTIGDYAAVSGIGLCAWEDSRGGVYWCVFEDDGGRITLAPQQASSTGERPRCVRVGDKLALIWAEDALGQLKVIMIDPTDPSAYAGTFPSVLVVDMVVGVPHFDAEYDSNLESSSGSGGAWIAWNAIDGIHVGVIDPSGVIGSAVTGWSAPRINATAGVVVVGPTIGARVSTSDSDRGLAVAHATAAQVYSSLYTYSASISMSHENLSLGYGAGADNLTVCWRVQWDDEEGIDEDGIDTWIEERASPKRNSVVTRTLVTSGTVIPADTVTIRGMCLASKAFSDREGVPYGASYVALVHDVPLFGVYVTVRHDGTPVARTLPGTAGDATARLGHLPQIQRDGDRVYRWTAIYRTLLESINNDVFTEDGLRLVRLDFDSADSHQTAYAGRTLYMGGACPMAYDGQGWVEREPHYAPDWDAGETIHGAAAGAGSISNGTRNYVFWYEWTLATGEVVRGGVSKPYTVTLAGADDTVEIDLPTLRLTKMASTASPARSDAGIVVARTIDGDTSSYYRCSSPNPSTTGLNGYATNDTTVDSVLWTDGMTDADLLEQEPAYFIGALENDPVTSSLVIAGGKGRLFMTDPSDDGIVRFSQTRIDGYAIEFAPDLQFSLDPYGGPVTAIAVLDDAVVIFKRSAIYAVAGPGPLPDPDVGGAWSAPVLITSDVGCISQRSIAVTPVGIVFQSAKGIYLLDRSQQTTYIGAPVEAYNAQSFVRATLVEDTTQIRFLTNDGTSLMFDYHAGQWSQFENHEGIDAVVVSGVYNYVRNDDRVFVESDGYDDAGTQIPMAIETAWIRLTDHLQGFQRIYHLYVLGTWKSEHSLRVQYATDYVDDWSEPLSPAQTRTAGTGFGEGGFGEGPFGGTAPSAYQMAFHIGRVCEAIKFRFVDIEEVGDAGAANEITEITITGGVKGSTYLIPAARRA